MVIILELFHPVVWLVRHVCSDKADFPVLQRKTALRLVVIILELSQPIVWLVRHVCSDKAEFSVLQRKTAFGRYPQRFCLEAWHINSAHAPLDRDDGGLPRFCYRRAVFSVKVRSPEPCCHVSNGYLLEFYQL